MNILSETKEIITGLNVPVETGIFKGKAPTTYTVLIPLTDSYPINADDVPLVDYQELRISLFSKGNYLQTKNRITKSLINAGYYITGRRYNGFDAETGYYQYTIDVAKNYDVEEDLT